MARLTWVLLSFSLLAACLHASKNCRVRHRSQASFEAEIPTPRLRFGFLGQDTPPNHRPYPNPTMSPVPTSTKASTGTPSSVSGRPTNSETNAPNTSDQVMPAVSQMPAGHPLAAPSAATFVPSAPTTTINSPNAHPSTSSPVSTLEPTIPTNGHSSGAEETTPLPSSSSTFLWRAKTTFSVYIANLSSNVVFYNHRDGALNGMAADFAKIVDTTIGQFLLGVASENVNVVNATVITLSAPSISETNFVDFSYSQLYGIQVALVRIKVPLQGAASSLSSPDAVIKHLNTTVIDGSMERALHYVCSMVLSNSMTSVMKWGVICQTGQLEQCLARARGITFAPTTASLSEADVQTALCGDKNNDSWRSLYAWDGFQGYIVWITFLMIAWLSIFTVATYAILNRIPKIMVMRHMRYALDVARLTMAGFVWICAVLRLLYFTLLIANTASAGIDNLACEEFSYSAVEATVVHRSTGTASVSLRYNDEPLTYVNPFFVVCYGLYFPMFLLTVIWRQRLLRIQMHAIGLVIMGRRRGLFRLGSTLRAIFFYSTIAFVFVVVASMIAFAAQSNDQTGQVVINTVRSLQLFCGIAGMSLVVYHAFLMHGVTIEINVHQLPPRLLRLRNLRVERQQQSRLQDSLETPILNPSSGVQHKRHKSSSKRNPAVVLPLPLPMPLPPQSPFPSSLSPLQRLPDTVATEERVISDRVTEAVLFFTALLIVVTAVPVTTNAPIPAFLVSSFLLRCLEVASASSVLTNFTIIHETVQQAIEDRMQQIVDDCGNSGSCGALPRTPCGELHFQMVGLSRKEPFFAADAPGGYCPSSPSADTLSSSSRKGRFEGVTPQPQIPTNVITLTKPLREALLINSDVNLDSDAWEEKDVSRVVPSGGGKLSHGRCHGQGGDHGVMVVDMRPICVPKAKHLKRYVSVQQKKQHAGLPDWVNLWMGGNEATAGTASDCQVGAKLATVQEAEPPFVGFEAAAVSFTSAPIAASEASFTKIVPNSSDRDGDGDLSSSSFTFSLSTSSEAVDTPVCASGGDLLPPFQRTRFAEVDQVFKYDCWESITPLSLSSVDSDEFTYTAEYEPVAEGRRSVCYGIELVAAPHRDPRSCLSNTALKSPFTLRID